MQNINTSFAKDQENNVIDNREKEEDESDKDKKDESKTVENFDAILEDIRIMEALLSQKVLKVGVVILIYTH